MSVSTAALLQSLEDFYANADKEAVTVKDCIDHLQRKHQVTSLSKDEKKAIRRHLFNLARGQATATTTPTRTTSPPPPQQQEEQQPKQPATATTTSAADAAVASLRASATAAANAVADVVAAAVAPPAPAAPPETPDALSVPPEITTGARLSASGTSLSVDYASVVVDEKKHDRVFRNSQIDNSTINHSLVSQVSEMILNVDIEEGDKQQETNTRRGRRTRSSGASSDDDNMIMKRQLEDLKEEVATLKDALVQQTKLQCIQWAIDHAEYGSFDYTSDDGFISNSRDLVIQILYEFRKGAPFRDLPKEINHDKLIDQVYTLLGGDTKPRIVNRSIFY